MQITDVEVTIVEIPQISPIAPYRSHIRTSSTTQSAIVRIETIDGLTGWGEYNVNFLPEISSSRDTAAARDWMLGRDASDLNGFHHACPLGTRLKSGLELALWDLAGKMRNCSVAELLGGVLRSQVEVAACMGIQSYERAGEIAAEYVERGFRCLKTKAGSDMREDLEMVRGIRDAVGDRLQLRIDPNRAYTPQEAVVLARELEPYNLEYLEQPIPAEPLEDATWLRQQTSVPIALNESVTDAASVWRILHAEAAEFILPDTHIAGGILPCVQIGHVCDAAQVACIMHCGHDLGPKTAAMLHIAAALPAYRLANDCTYYGLEDDVLCEPFQIEAGCIRVPTVPGLGCDVDPDKLRHYQLEC